METDRRVVGSGFGRRRSSDGEFGAFYRSPERQEAYRCALPKWAGAKFGVAYLETEIIKKHRAILIYYACLAFT